MKNQNLKTYLGTVLLMALFQFSARAQQWDWSKKIEPVGSYSRVEVLAIDQSGGNYFLTGRFIGSVHYTDAVYNTVQTATSSSIGSTDLFVARADNTGRLYWFSKGGSSGGDDQGNDIAIIGTSVYVTGYIGKDDYSGATTATFYSSYPASATCTVPIYANHKRKAFVASYNNTVGGINWVAGIEDSIKKDSIAVESEGRGICKDPTGSRFFVTGYFRGKIEYGAYYTSSGIQYCSAQCSTPVPFQDSSYDSTYNTYVIQYNTSGCTNWFTSLRGASGNDWNVGEDIAAYTSGNGTGDYVYVTGAFHGDLIQNTNNPSQVTNTVTGATGYHLIMSTSQQQAGYIVKLQYNNSGWTSYGFPATCKPTYGFICWNNNSSAPVYNAEKMEGGYVRVKSLALRYTTNSDPTPVVVGEWFDHSRTAPVLYANHQGTPLSATNSSTYYSDVFIAQYPGDLLSCNWLNTIKGSLDEFVGGDDESNPASTFHQGRDGACGVACDTRTGDIMLTGSFTGSCTVSSVSASSKNIYASSGNSNDMDAYAVTYDATGNAMMAENIASSCTYISDYGTAVSNESSGGGYLTGYSNSSLGFNTLCPMNEFDLNQSTTGSSMSYFGKHQEDECFSNAITATSNIFPVVPNPGEFRVRRTVGSTFANVDYNLPAGGYNIAYRNPTTSNPYDCINGSAPGWINIPLSVPVSGAGTILIGTGGAGPALSASVTYEWFIQSHCAGGLGRWGVIDPMNKIMAKTTAAIDNAGTESSINMYPNPAAGTLNIDIHNIDVTQMIIMDCAGRIIKTYNSNELQPQLDVNFLSSGVYMVTFKNGDQTIVVKPLNIVK